MRDVLPHAREPRVLLEGLAYVESPRWHDGRLWFSHWGTEEIVAVDLDGNSEVVGHGPSGLGWATDWLPDGRLLVTGPELLPRTTSPPTAASRTAAYGPTVSRLTASASTLTGVSGRTPPRCRSACVSVKAEKCSTGSSSTAASSPRCSVAPIDERCSCLWPSGPAPAASTTRSPDGRVRSSSPTRRRPGP